MKNIFYLLTFSMIVLFSNSSFACDISLTADKDSYRIGDTALIALELNWTHKTCLKESIAPQIKVSGLEILAKTKYKEKSSGIWGIKYKFKVTALKATLNAYQDCLKGGGTASLTLKITE